VPSYPSRWTQAMYLLVCLRSLFVGFPYSNATSFSSPASVRRKHEETCLCPQVSELHVFFARHYQALSHTHTHKTSHVIHGR
jgi:hypothetical protein